MKRIYTRSLRELIALLFRQRRELHLVAVEAGNSVSPGVAAQLRVDQKRQAAPPHLARAAIWVSDGHDNP